MSNSKSTDIEVQKAASWTVNEEEISYNKLLLQKQ
jgi:hypothetical protein